MQGTLSEIDIRSILQLIELGQRTGELLVEAYPSRLGGKGKERLSQGRQETQSSARLSPFHRAVWFIFFVNGQIIYATDNSNNSLFRLRDYLYLYQAQDALNQLHLPAITTTNAPEYASVWMLLEHHILTPAQGRRIIQSMIRETLFDLLSLHQGSFIFKIAPALAPQLKTWEVAPLMKTIIKQVQHWKAFYPQIQSPHQALLVNDDAKLQAALPSDVYQNLSGWIDGKTSLRQIARYLNRDLVTIAKLLYPYLERGWLHLTPTTIISQEPKIHPLGTAEQPQKRPQIVLIDDDITIGKQVEAILKSYGYGLTIIQDPIAALSQMFHLQPDLILCDITMPQLEGDEICAMLRNSTIFRQIPIIMLTGKDAFIDRVKARMRGATDYLTKPFGEQELLLLLEKYLAWDHPQNLSQPALV